MIRLITLAPLVAPLAAAALAQAGAPAPAPPQPVGLPLWVQAQAGTAYVVKCHIRSFRGPLGVFANTYYLDTKGPYRDRIPSPNAQCVFGKVKGEGPVTLHIAKAGDHAATVTLPGKWVRLEVW